MKRLIASVALLGLIMTYTVIPVSAAQDIEDMYIDFDSGQASSMSVSGSKEYRDYDGITGIYISDSTGNKRLDVDVSDSDIYAQKKSSVKITVWYYDIGTGYFTITYDGRNGASDAEPVVVENTGEWRSHTFYIYDGAFSNGYNGFDFAVNLNSSLYGQSRCALTVGRIEAEFLPQQGIDVNAASERAGNIFIEGDDIAFDVEFKSTVFEKQEANVSYKLINERSGETVWNGSDKISLGAKGTEVRRIKPEFNEFGLFILETECESVDGKYYSMSREKTSYSVKNDEKNDQFGTVVHFTERDSGAVAPLIAANGIAYIRDEFLWEDYEKQRGVYSFLPEWERYLSDVEEAGLEPLIILGFSNPNYHSGAVCVPKTEEELEAYGNYVYNLVSFLGDRCMMYEVWNEPNLKTFSEDQTPEAYFPVLKVAYENVKKANPDAKVMGCSTAGIDPDWHRTVFEMGGAEYMDILSFHFYYLDKKVMDPSVDLCNRLKEVDELCEEFNPDLKMAITEYGWAVNVYPTSPQMQLDDFIKTMTIFKSIPRIEYTFWYEYQDSGISMYDKERNFGFVEYWERETPYAAKPIYCGSALFNKVIGNAPIADYIENNDMYIYRFGNNSRGKGSMILWAEDKHEYVTLNLGCDNITVYDAYGNQKVIYGSDGVFSLMTGDRPMIVEGDFTSFETCEPQIKLTDDGVVRVVANEEHEFRADIPSGMNVEFTGEDGSEIMETDDSLIKYKVTGDIGDVRSIGLRVYDGEKLYFEGNIYITVIPKAEGSIASLPYLDSFGKTIICINVKNNSTSPISGTAQLTAPYVFTSKLTPSEFSSLSPGESTKCYVYLPSFSRGGHYKFGAQIKLADGEIFEVSSDYDRSFAKRCQTPPTIDGVIEKGEYDQNYAMQTVPENIVDLFDEANRGEQDLSATFYVSYDDEKIYIAAEATDDVHYQVEDTANMWRGDGIQFGLCDKTAVPVVSKEIGISLRGSQVQITGYDSTVYPMETAVTRSGNKTVYEAAVPIAGVFGEDWSIEGRESIGFSILVNDNDGPDTRSTQSGRKGWAEYGSGIGSAKNTDLYVDLKLDE